MQIDLKTVNIEPKRKAFDHLVRRFGDKAASRYQEGSYDIQAAENLHYRPTWAPEQLLYDASITTIVMEDWYAFRDPRQYYYNTYTLTRARQQETVEGAFSFVESRGLHLTVPGDVLDEALSLLVPLRHAVWGANQNNVLVAGYGFGTTFTQPCLYYGMDCLGVAQYLSRIGLLFGGTQALASGKSAWTEDEVWQPLRRLVEDMMIVRDPFELFIAQDVALDGLLYPVVFEHVIDNILSPKGATPVSMLCQFMVEWSAETQKWADSVVKIAAAESRENSAVLAEWFTHWSSRAITALIPPIARVIGKDADQLIADCLASLKARMVKAGVAL